MARSPLFSSLQRACRLARISRRSSIPVNEVIDRLSAVTHRPTLSRRRLLQGGLAVAGAIAGASLSQAITPATTDARTKVLIVGAGIAGLVAAHHLTKAGVPVDIVEAKSEVGGRIHSLANAAGTQTTVELGGEFIDSDHEIMLGLAKELGLQVNDLQVADANLPPFTFFFNGRLIDSSEVLADFALLVPSLERDAALLDNLDSPEAIALDRLSISQYLKLNHATPLLTQLLEVAYTIEYGREASEQSSINLLFLIGTDPTDFQIFGTSDERYHIVGGNAQIPQLLAAKLANSISTGTALEAIRSLSDGSYRVNLRSGYSSVSRTYDRILITIPFSVLRDVQLDVNLPHRKRRVIEQLSYGTNSKLITAYQNRIWRTQHNSNGEVFTDLGYQNTWEATRYAPGNAGLLTNFTGGKRGVSVGLDSPESQAKRLLPQYDQVFPGLAALRQGQAVRAFWTGDSHSKGSYACYLVGDWRRFHGEEGKRVGNLFFAGEHCSQNFQGYMEGGCETGQAAAEEIIQDLSGAQQQRSLPQLRRKRLQPSKQNDA